MIKCLKQARGPFHKTFKKSAHGELQTPNGEHNTPVMQDRGLVAKIKSKLIISMQYCRESLGHLWSIHLNQARTNASKEDRDGDANEKNKEPKDRDQNVSHSCRVEAVVDARVLFLSLTLCEKYRVIDGGTIDLAFDRNGISCSKAATCVWQQVCIQKKHDGVAEFSSCNFC